MGNDTDELVFQLGQFSQLAVDSLQFPICTLQLLRALGNHVFEVVAVRPYYCVSLKQFAFRSVDRLSHFPYFIFRLTRALP